MPTLIFKGKLHRDFLERFGVYDEAKARDLSSGGAKIWIQAVSVGEVAVCRRLIPIIREKFPRRQIVLSTITKTGNDLAKRLFSQYATVIYFPLDLSFIVKKVVHIIRPKLYIMVETEIWPNLLAELLSSGIGAVLINGRISDRSYGKYRAVRFALKKVLGMIRVFCMQSEADAVRIISLGAPKERVRVTGNMKFDVDIVADEKLLEEMRKTLGLGPGDELFVAGSTHRGEEDIILAAYKDVSAKFPKLRLLIAPRHIERTGEVDALAREAGFETLRFSKISPVKKGLGWPGDRVIILDTIGLLSYIYAISTACFVGGSLVRHGGQNPIEPALFEKPIIFGPHMFNFKDVASLFLEKGAAIRICDKKGMEDELEELLSDPAERAQMGGMAKKTVLENRGATLRNLEMISGMIRL